MKQEFEQAIEDNSILLEDMAIRFIKICGCFDPFSKIWWSYMKDLFQTKCVVSSLKKLFVDNILLIIIK